MTDWTRVQGADDDTTGLSVSFGVAVTSGSIVWGGIGLNTGNALLSVTDDKSNIYDITAGGDDEAILAVFGFKSRGLITNGPTTITITTSIAVASFCFKAIEEWTPPTGTTAISLNGSTWFAMPSGGIQGLTNLQTSPFQTTLSDVLLAAVVFDQDAAFGFGAGWTIGINHPANITFTASQIQATASNSNQLTFSSNANTAWGVCFGIAPVAASSWVPVQRTFAPLVTATSVTLTFAQPVTAGNVIIGGFGAVGGISTIIDNLGAHYEGDLLSSVANHAIWSPLTLMSTTPKSFVLTQGASQPIAATIAEFAPPSGINTIAIDGSAVQDHYTGVSITSLSTPTITTTLNNDLVYSWITSGASVQDNPTGGQNMLSHWGIKNADAYSLQVTPASLTPTWNFAGSTDVILFGVAINASFQSGIVSSPTPIRYLGWYTAA